MNSVLAFGLDFHIGLPKDDLHRVTRLIQRPPDFSRAAALDPSRLPEPMRELVTAMIDPNSLTRRAYACVEPPFDHDDPAEQTAEIPATNGICTAHALARFYAALIGEVDNHRILDPETLAAATTPQVTGPDLVTRQPFHLGVGLGLPAPGAAWHSPTAFGFPGLGGSLGYADPATGLAFGYVMNHIRQNATADQPSANLVKALRSVEPAIAR